MKKFKTKFATVMLVVSCAFAGVGATNLVFSDAYNVGITANAETAYTEYTATEIGAANGSSSEVLYIYPTAGVDAFPNGNEDWAHVYSFEVGSGDGMKLNEETLTTTDIKLPGTDLYVGLGETAQTGDIFTIDGAYYNEDTKIKLIFDNCSLVYKGNGKWDSYVKCTEYTVSDLTLHANSTTNTVLWISMTGGATVSDWPWFEYEIGAGFKVNGETAALTGNIANAIQDFGGGLYLTFAAVQAGDIVSIGGTFVNKDLAIRYIIPETYFQWNGSGWTAYQPPVEYTPYDITNLKVYTDSMAGGTNAKRNDVLQLTMEGGASVSDWPWFVYESGAGFKVNGESAALTGNIANAIQDTTGGLYLVFNGVNAGDVVSIGGTFVNDDLALKYVIPESKFVWTGSGWETYVENIEYTQFEVGKLTVRTGNAKEVYFIPATVGVEFPINSWTDPFSYVSGNGITVNGTMISMENSVKSPSGDFYVDLGQPVSTGAILKIGGVLRCEAFTTDYVIEDCSFTWNGFSWISVDEVDTTEYTTHEFGVIEPNSNSAAVGAESARPDHLYTIEVSKLPVQDWGSPFVLESGYGVKINGEATSFEVKSTDGGLWFGLSGVQTNDLVSICGTFKNKKHAVKYVIEESKMFWNGFAWETLVDTTGYEYNEIGSTNIVSKDSTASAVYIYRADGNSMPVSDWEKPFRFSRNSGVGVTLNGSALNFDMKSADGNIYIGLGTTAKDGDVLVVGGEFYCVYFEVVYNITDSTFIFTDGVWINAIDKVKGDAKDELDAYRASFVQENYYDAEWNSFDTIIEEGKASINAAMTSEEIASIVVSVKTKMDDVLTKEESDAIFESLKQSSKVDVENYKSESDYRADDWATIQTIITDAIAQIDESTSVTEINTVVENAKAEMDAVKTSAQRDADDDAVANAKADLAAYKSESDYRADDWTIIQTIIADAGAQIDEVIGNETAIGEIVVSAKEEIDAVKTSAQRDADDAAVANAKADLASYKSAVDYRDAQWAEIQAIITKANGDIDLAVGDQTAIDAIVTNAKKDVDKVKTSKTVAKDEVREYYGAIDHSLYSEDAEEIISGYMAEVLTAIDNATTNEQIDTAIAEFKGKVEKVEKLKPAGDGSDKKGSGCFGSMGAFGLTSILGLVGVVSLIRRKKEER